MVYEYEIDGVTYIQKPLVLGQLKQLLAILQHMRIPADADALELIMAIGNDLPDVLAVVLTEKGQSPRDKDLQAMADRLAYTVTMETALRVIEDFFDCNRTSSLLERIAEGLVKIARPASIGLMSSSSSSPEVTSPTGTPSSGDVDAMNLNPG